MYSNDKKDGFGLFKWVSGNYYLGQYSNDEREGIGEMNWNDGSKYIGEWVQGIEHGCGRIILPEGIEKIGNFENNVYVGPIHKLVHKLNFLEYDFNIYSLANPEVNIVDIENEIKKEQYIQTVETELNFKRPRRMELIPQLKLHKIQNTPSEDLRTFDDYS